MEGVLVPESMHKINIVNCDSEFLLFSFPRLAVAEAAIYGIDSGRRSGSRDGTWHTSGQKRICGSG